MPPASVKRLEDAGLFIDCQFAGTRPARRTRKESRDQTRIHSPMAVHQQPAIEKLETNSVGSRNAD